MKAKDIQTRIKMQSLAMSSIKQILREIGSWGSEHTPPKQSFLP